MKFERIMKQEMMFNKLNVVHLLGDGPILSLILAVLDKCGYTPGDEQEVSSASEMVHQIAESIKFGYAAKTHLGDEKFLKNKTVSWTTVWAPYGKGVS